VGHGMNERRVYFNEYGLLQGGQGKTAYLPLVSGVLHAYALRHDDLRDAFSFMPYHFHRDRAETLVEKHERPDVAAFSMYMWNRNLSLEVARAVKRRHPGCLTVFGGASVPHHARGFLEEHPWIDVAVRAEGEEAWIDVLRRRRDGADFEGLPGLTWRTAAGRIVENEGQRASARGLDAYPSPYLDGLFDELVARRTDVEFQAILETNRGCPFRCTFCYWGKGGLNRKFKFHSPERIGAEIDWFARHRLPYVLSADSNFGMHEQDRQTARFLIEAHERHGYPKRFRATYGKNTDQRIFEIASDLWRAGLDKGVSLSRQSNDPEVQRNIKRGNIKMDTYRKLQARFNEAGIPTHTDLIVGLPGETLETLARGVDELLESDCVHINMYFLEVYPNTDMADPAYQQEFGIRTVRTSLQENHCDVRDPDDVPEYVDVVVETAAMNNDEWKRMWSLALVTMLFHSLKMGFYVMHYLRRRHGVPYGDFLVHVSREGAGRLEGTELDCELGRFREALEGICRGEGHNAVEPGFGNVYWRIEEAGFLRLSRVLDRFYEELGEIVADWLAERGVAFDREELDEVMRYQRMRIPSCEPAKFDEWRFHFNVPEYFERLLGPEPCALVRKPQWLRIDAVDYGGDRWAFARERVLFARKNESTVNAVRWGDGTSLPERAG
jgi:radical SAM superfamily enzyme YgiQ (UPF0313 family)